eukprot:NODE_659_length_5444_cov_0.092423.p4 type:complete len:148 gc:universal NODE_659_length_5444_cov_0.092423:3165-3608(+)
MPGLLRSAQQSPFSLNNDRTAINFMESYRPQFHTHLNFPENEEDPEDEDIEDEEDEDDQDGDTHNHELSQLLDRILYGQQRPRPDLTTLPDYTASRIEAYSNRIRMREPFIRFGDEAPVLEPVDSPNISVSGLRDRYSDHEPGESTN